MATESEDRDDAPARNLGLPRAVGIFSLPVVGAAGLPLLPDGSSFLELLGGAFEREIIEGLVIIAGHGSPFLLGLSLCLAGLVPMGVRGHEILRSWSYAALCMVHVQLILTGIVLVRGGIGLVPHALLGVGIVSGIHLAYYGALCRARRKSSEGTPPHSWIARWGAMLIVTISAWLRLQRIDGVQFGVAVDVLMAAALLLGWRTARPNNPSDAR